MLAIMLSVLLCVPFSGVSAFAEVNNSPDVLEEANDIDAQAVDKQAEDTLESDAAVDSSATQAQDQNKRLKQHR